MLRLAADENFNGHITRGLLLREPGLELVRLQDVGLRRANDPDVLEWAAQNNRIILTHDRATMAMHAQARVTAANLMPGVFILDDKFPVGRAIDELRLLIACTEQSEWNNRIVYLPL